ncbi:MAG: serine/threonine protein kinase, partial [Myxococcales bacterium]|nr:serine/threonine protein kinase [Myxococcales bacterium]
MSRLDRLRSVDKGRVLAGLFGAPAPTRSIGRFELLDRVGDGGMGVVHRARDTTLEREVAVKILHAEATGVHRERLLREARALAQLVHPNVIAVYDAGECDGRLFIAMEFVRGRTLLEWQRAPHPWWECLEHYAQAGRGLAAAHRVGIIHRDFKPANCILDEAGCVKVLDFGLARGVDELDDPELERRFERLELDDEEALDTLPPRDQLGTVLLRLTRTGAVLGTPAYMPPEQIAGRRPHARGDQFSFCVALYE